MQGDLVAWHVGSPAPTTYLDLPGLTWHGPRHTLTALVPADDVELLDGYRDGSLRLGLTQYAPAIPVLLLRVSDTAGRTLGYWEAPSLWLDGSPEPSTLDLDGGQHIMWSLAVAVCSPERGPSLPAEPDGSIRPVCSSLRAFTTSPAFTRVLRRLRAEQRAAGPMSEADAMAAVIAAQERTPGGSATWRRALITSAAGD